MCVNLCMFACDVQTSILGKRISDSFCQKQGGLAYFAEYYPPANIRQDIRESHCFYKFPEDYLHSWLVIQLRKIGN